MYTRIVSLAAVGLLAIGLAACGKSPSKPAHAGAGAVDGGTGPAEAAITSPSSAASKAPLPDKDSCRNATDLFQRLGFRTTTFRQGVQDGEPGVHIYFLRLLPDLVSNTSQVKASTLDARVKTIVEGYQADLEQLKGKLEEAGEDRAKQLAAFDTAVTKHTKASQDLTALCAETLANDGGRAPTCMKVDEAEKKFSGPLQDLDAANNDRNRLSIVLPTFNRALDTAVSELRTASDQSVDSQIKTAIARRIADLGQFKNSVSRAGLDGARIDSAISTAAAGTGRTEIDRLCHS